MRDDASSAVSAVSRPLVAASLGIAGVLIAATLLLWAHYGGTVFYEMVLAGIASCF